MRKSSLFSLSCGAVLALAATTGHSATFKCEGTTDSVMIRVNGTLNVMFRYGHNLTRQLVLCTLEPVGATPISKSLCQDLAREIMTAHAARMEVEVNVNTDFLAAGIYTAPPAGVNPTCEHLAQNGNIGQAGPNGQAGLLFVNVVANP
jgi:hypothetical protein